ncbi:YceI family protein [Maribellus mangrovi]|uniref:YceI family protein n=1 Tax=Maribellus mangrovi TaxID=3133146 RepID=UPI0030EB868C
MTTKKTVWTLDPTHSEITFKVKHMMISNVKGEFKNFNAFVEGDELEKAKIKATINSSSVYTNNDDRDNHLKSADFFDAENHKELTFDATSFKKVDNDEYKLNGVLTIKGVSKEVTFDVEFGGTSKDPWGNEKAGFSLDGKLNRKDWGLNYNAVLESGGVLLSEDVKIQAEVQFVKQTV